MKKLFVTLLMAAVVGIGGFVVTQKNTQPEPQALGGFNPTGGLTYRLQSSIGLNNTTLTLSSFKNRSGIPLTMSLMNTDIAYATIDPQSSNSEFVSFTGVTQNANGTATLTGLTRGLSDVYPFTASSTMQQPHAGQAVFILSDSPQLFNEYAAKRNNETISGVWDYTQYPTATSSLGTATTSRQFITLGQAQGLANQGAATSTESVTGIVRLATALQQASSTYLGVDTPTVLQSRYATDTPQYGCAVGYTGTAGAGCTVIAQLTGKIRQTWLNLTEAWTVTGEWTFNGGGTATTTFNRGVDIDADSDTPLILRLISYIFPSTGGTSGQVLTTDGGSPQTLSWATTTPIRYVWTNSSPGLAPSSGNFATSSDGLFIPGGLLTASSTIEVKAGTGQVCVSSSSGAGTVYLRDSSGNTLWSGGLSSDTNTVTGYGQTNNVVIASTNANFTAQRYIADSVTAAGTTPTSVSASTGGGTASINFASDVTLKMVVQNAGCDSTAPSVGAFSVVVER